MLSSNGDRSNAQEMEGHRYKQKPKVLASIKQKWDNSVKWWQKSAIANNLCIQSNYRKHLTISRQNENKMSIASGFSFIREIGIIYEIQMQTFNNILNNSSHSAIDNSGRSVFFLGSMDSLIQSIQATIH